MLLHQKIAVLQNKFQVNRTRLEFYYSIFILVIIPVLITANTLLLVVSVRRSFDTELRRKADLANTIIGTLIADQLEDPSAVQAIIVSIVKEKPELKRITIAIPTSKNGEFRTIAANDATLIGQETSNLQFAVVSSRNQSVAQLIKDSADGSRLWSVVSPLRTNGNQVSGVLSTDVSLQEADALISNALLKSLVIVFVTMLVVVLLLLNHFRFVQYAMLFRKLKEVDQLKNDFLSVATHELKTPMAIIKGNIENIIDGLSGNVDDKAKETLRGMSHETDRLNNLVNDLLNVSRLEQGRVSYDIKPVDLRPIIENVVSQLTPKAQAKNLTLHYEQPNGSCVVLADEGRAIEIMTNIIDNAIKYSRRGAVTIAHKLSDDKVITTVRDTGIGMTADERDKLFTRFYRIKNENTRGIAGTGLGLWIVKQYVEHMKGTINVESLEGVGSEFVITFPRNMDTQQNSNSPASTT